MGFNRENYDRIKEEYSGKYLRAQEAARLRRAEIHALLPEIAKIDAELSASGIRVFEASLRGDEKMLDEIKEENLALNGVTYDDDDEIKPALSSEVGPDTEFLIQDKVSKWTGITKDKLEAAVEALTASIGSVVIDAARAGGEAFDRVYDNDELAGLIDDALVEG